MELTQLFMSRSVLIIVGLFVLFPSTTSAARLWSSGCELQGDGVAGSINLNTNMEFSTSVGGDGTGGANMMQVWPTVKRTGLSSCRGVATTTGDGRASHAFTTSTVATDLYFRAYFYIETAPAIRVPAMSVWDVGIDGTEGSIEVSTDRYLVYTDDDRTPLATSTAQLALDTWYLIEWNYDAADAVEVKINGVSEISVGAHDGDAADAFRIGFSDDAVAGSIGEFLFDDMAINDTSGTAQTGYPGAGSIVHIEPDANGDSNGCSAGDWDSVNEITPDDGSTFCNLDLDSGGDLFDVNTESASTAGIDSFDTVTLVQVGYRFAGATAATHTLNARVKSASGGTVTSGTTITGALSTYANNDDGVPRNYSLTSYTDPTTAVAWTPTGTNSLDNMQIGINSADANPDVRTTTLWALVDYVDGAAPVVTTPKVIINGKTILQSKVIIP